ncbi:E3 ubiquitin-protein ligase RFWD3 [Eumeta japonica]|uniref:RING-type E3 ubiquitin transferase n=1 Tax=Eumeta variegata TaxID=151549 RepID=A0A4C1ZYU5_EUMVA|nr:E3 ubiquitin-protein ligase RFWD3 [Eumeta japonica]
MNSNQNPDFEAASQSILVNYSPSRPMSLTPETTVDNDSTDLNNENELRPIAIEDSTSEPTRLADGPISHVDKVSDKNDRCKEPPAKQPRLMSPDLDEQDGETCPICLDSWSSSGDHRLVSLKCGHLFGYRCVEKWLRARKTADRSCPTCKSKAAIKDIRYIYAKKLVACDTSEITTLQKQVEVLQAEKNRLELELHQSKISYKNCLQQLYALEQASTRNSARAHVFNCNWRFALEKNMEISKEGGCRVLTYNCKRYELLVSQKSSNNLFPGFGVRKVGCIDHRLGQFIHLHPKPIRDISYSQPNDFLLSVSLDGTAKILDRDAPSLTIQAGFPLWSCTWDEMHTQEFVVGGVGGIALRYDIRNTSTPLRKLTVLDKTPVVSVCWSDYGLLSCQLNSCWLWTQTPNGEVTPISLPVDGPFLSLGYQSGLSKALINCRPRGNGAGRSRLVICQMSSGGMHGTEMCDIVHTFSGSTRSTVMSRACWVTIAGGANCPTWAAAYSESDTALLLHGLDGARSINLPASEPALDICSMHINKETIVASLSENRLRVYKAVQTA